MTADSNSRIAWYRVQLKRNREALKTLEVARFSTGLTSGAAGQASRREIENMKRKIAESERCIAAHDRQTKRPLATDLKSLAQVSWGVWHANALQQPVPSRAYHR